MSQPSADFLANAVDLAALNPATPTADDTAGEFSVAIVGDQRGRPHVMLTFGHLQWMFEPHLAADLAAVLADAAKQAEQMPAQPSNQAPHIQPGAATEVLR